MRSRKRLQFSAERVLAKGADQRARRAGLYRCERLVRALATGKVKHRITGDGLADAGMPLGGRHHIHVDASGDENAAHGLFPRAGYAWTSNSCLTASMSATVGSPASLPRR